MAVSVSFDVESKIRIGDNIRTCYWGPLVEVRLAQQFPDLIIKFEEQKGRTVIFTMEFNNRPTFKEDIRSRLFSFIRYYPSMHMSNLEIKLLE